MTKNFSFLVNDRKRKRKTNTETKVHFIPITSPDDRSAFLKKLEISAHFNMRYRGLYEYYGDDLIEYKKLHFSDSTCNQFLHIFSHYITDYLEDLMPSSWNACEQTFLEHLLYFYLPFTLKISPEHNEIEQFTKELKRFFLWLDKRENTTFSSMLEQFNQTILELKNYELLLNDLFLLIYPSLHEDHWDFDKEQQIQNERIKNCITLEDSVFQVTNRFYHILSITDIFTKKTYQISGLPADRIPVGTIIHGLIGLEEEGEFWTWLLTSGVYSKIAKNYFLATH